MTRVPFSAAAEQSPVVTADESRIGRRAGGGRVTVGGQRGLAFFNRSAEPELVVEVLGDAEAVLPRPAEAGYVLSVDHLRQRFGTIVHAVRGFREQAPLWPPVKVQPLLKAA